MAIIGDALRQAFMPKHEYDSLRDEEKAWSRLQRPLLTFFVVAVWIAVLVSAFVSLTIVFPTDAGNRLLCRSTDRRVQELLGKAAHESDPFRGSFYLTENQLANYYWMVVFLPSAIVFFASVVYLVSGLYDSDVDFVQFISLLEYQSDIWDEKHMICSFLPGRIFRTLDIIGYMTGRIINSLIVIGVIMRQEARELQHHLRGPVIFKEATNTFGPWAMTFP